MNRTSVVLCILCAAAFVAAASSVWADEGPPDPISIDRASPSILLGGNTPGDIYDMLPVPASGMGWDVGGPGPIIHVADTTYGLGPLDNNDAHSNGEVNPNAVQSLYFSGDDSRDMLPGDVSMGAPGTDYNHQALLGQAAGDRFMVNGLTTLSPAAVMGGAGPAGIVPGGIPGGLGNFPVNLLSANQTRYNEIPSIGPGVSNPFVAPPGFTAQDDMDALELTPFDLSIIPDGIHDTPIYFSLDPFSPGLFASPADILVSPPATAGYTIFAGSGLLGLGAGDDVDALAVWDVAGDLAASAGDFALFSLTPASPTLHGLDGLPGLAFVDDDGINGVDDLGEVGLGDDLSPADIFVTDFSSAFTLFLAAPTIGMLATDNVDAIDVELFLQQPLENVPEPTSFVLLALGGIALLLARRRRRG